MELSLRTILRSMMIDIWAGSVRSWAGLRVCGSWVVAVVTVVTVVSRRPSSLGGPEALRVLFVVVFSSSFRPGRMAWGLEGLRGFGTVANGRSPSTRSSSLSERVVGLRV